MKSLHNQRGKRAIKHQKPPIALRLHGVLEDFVIDQARKQGTTRQQIIYRAIESKINFEAESEAIVAAVNRLLTDGLEPHFLTIKESLTLIFELLKKLIERSVAGSERTGAEDVSAQGH